MAITGRKFLHVDFAQEPCDLGLLEGGAAVVAVTDNAVNTYRLTKPSQYLKINNTGQNDIKVPVVAATGWTLPCDNIDADGIEINPSSSLAAGREGPLQFTVGTDGAFYLQGAFLVTTLANIDVLQMGFRRQAAYANVTTPATAGTAYDDAMIIGINDNAGAIATQCELNNSGAPVITACTNTPAVTAQSVAFRVDVSAAGVCTFKVGLSGATATPAAAIAALTSDTLANAVAVASRTFDSGDVVIPCIFLVATGAGQPNVVLQHLSCGHA